MARTALVALALLLCAGAALAGDCGSLLGCTACRYDAASKKGMRFVCTQCDGAGYQLKEKRGRCECAPGFYSRAANGTKLSRCVAVPAGHVAQGAQINDAGSIARACNDHSVPDRNRASCLCKAGYYAIVAGQMPRCVPCAPGWYTDEPNARLACKVCPVGLAPNAARTSCVALLQALREAGSAVADLPSAAAAQGRAAVAEAGARINSTLHGVTARLGEMAPKAPHLNFNLTQAAASAAAKAKARAEAKSEAKVAKDAAPAKSASPASSSKGKDASRAKDAPALPAHNATAAGRTSGPANAAHAPLANLVPAAGNLTSHLRDSLRDTARKVQKSVALPLNGTIPPVKQIPGLEHGANNTRDALLKVAKGLAKDQGVRDMLFKTIPGGLKEAVEAINSMGSAPAR